MLKTIGLYKRITNEFTIGLWTGYGPFLHPSTGNQMASYQQVIAPISSQITFHCSCSSSYTVVPMEPQEYHNRISLSLQLHSTDMWL